MLKVSMLALVLSVSATSLMAETFTCKETAMSQNGFTTQAAARSWFAKEFTIGTNGSIAISKRYGKGTVASNSRGKVFTFVSASSVGKRTSVIITYIQKSSRYSIKLRSAGNMQQTPGARGKCTIS